MLLNTKLVTHVALVQSHPRCTGPPVLQFCFSPQGTLCQISAWRHTKGQALVWEEMLHL